MLPAKVPPRVAVEAVSPHVAGGRVPIRRVPGDAVEVSADVFSDGSGGVRASLRWKPAAARSWKRLAMQPLGNDRWHAAFVVTEPGEYLYAVDGWVDPYLSWRLLLERRRSAGTLGRLDLEEGAELLRVAGRRLPGRDGRGLVALGDRLAIAARTSLEDGYALAMDADADRILGDRPDLLTAGSSHDTYRVSVDPPIAQHSRWYELFPRSTSPEPGRAGTLSDLRARLPYVADLGFDVVYLPPVHPIGRTHRRGPNNTSPAPPGAPGSPWAIGGPEGGHVAVHPALGTLDDFRTLVREARALGLEVALDLAFQCSPDHPWVREHPEWFQHLPDGTIRTAENPPKKYDDIYPLDFATPDWQGLWKELRSVVDFWVAEGIRWFRVDNPHTKPFEFWRWLIGEVRRDHPEVMFLAEAFTRPKVMYRLAQVGFTHSYTYFAWRSSKAEIQEYFRELSVGPVAEYFRPHLWPNTPDILTEQFHAGDRSVFLHRLVLAATLASHYGIYGPTYELMEHAPIAPGMEEYLRSEKYEVRHWPLDRPGSLAPEIRAVNAIRRAHPALETSRRLTFHAVDNDQLIAYSRRTEDFRDVVLVVVNLDPRSPQAGWTRLDLSELGLSASGEFEVRELLTGESYRWRGERNFVRLDPARWPAHVLEVVRPAGAGPSRVG